MPALKAKATARGSRPSNTPRKFWSRIWRRSGFANPGPAAKKAGLDQLSMDEIDAEIAAARKARREAKPQPGA